MDQFIEQDAAGCFPCTEPQGPGEDQPTIGFLFPFKL